MSHMHNPAHPGKVLKEWLDGISVTEAAAKLGSQGHTSLAF